MNWCGHSMKTGPGCCGLEPGDTGQFIHYQYDETNPWSLSHNFVQAIYEDHHGRFWVGTNGGGLNLFDRVTEQFAHYQGRE